MIPSLRRDRLMILKQLSANTEIVAHKSLGQNGAFMSVTQQQDYLVHLA